MESKVDDPLKTIESFNRQSQLNQPHKEAVEWAWPQEMGDTMYAVVNIYCLLAKLARYYLISPTCLHHRHRFWAAPSCDHLINISRRLIKKLIIVRILNIVDRHFYIFLIA